MPGGGDGEGRVCGRFHSSEEEVSSQRLGIKPDARVRDKFGSVKRLLIVTKLQKRASSSNAGAIVVRATRAKGGGMINVFDLPHPKHLNCLEGPFLTDLTNKRAIGDRWG
jgi:hypothetical protein